MRSPGIALVLVLSSAVVFAQGNNPAPTYTACVDKQGRIYAFSVGDKPLDVCKKDEVQVRLGSGDITSIETGAGLLGGADSGVGRLGIAPSFQLPQTCKAGQVVAFDGKSWACVTLAQPQPQGSRVWVGVYWHFYRSATGPGPVSEETFTVYYLNPGDETNKVGCTFFDHNGVLLLGGIGTSYMAPPGGLGLCSYFPDRLGVGWVIVSAERPILPHGAQHYQDPGSGRMNAESNLEWFPVDCSNARGFEFVCRFIVQTTEAAAKR